jgi:DNA-binding response OmpR family regulator
MRIFLAEPDAQERETIRGVLLQAGYEVEPAKEGEERIEPADCAAVILALQSPWGDGLDVVRRLREDGYTHPVLLLASKEESDLLARLRARFRCRAAERKRILRVEDLELDTSSRRVSRKGERIDLTPRQFNVLEVLMLESPNAVSKAKIVERVWGEAVTTGTNVVNVVVNQLRNRIDLPGCPALLHTVRGVGFVLRKKAE